jgi:hypothetical protein
MKCKIVRFQKLMWCNMMRSTKNKKTLVLHYSTDIDVLGLKRDKDQLGEEDTTRLLPVEENKTLKSIKM